VVDLQQETGMIGMRRQVTRRESQAGSEE